LIVVDEVSMVDERMGRDLISFGKKILVVGDPYQLPPIHGEGFFTSDPPDIFLKKIHRQAEGSPIIQMATIIRNGGWLKSGVRGESSVVTSIETRDLPTYDIIIAGLHPMRRRVNRDLRKLLGFSGPPQVGDRLLCTRNSNGSRRMMNGTLWDVLEIHGTSDGFISMTLVDEFNEQTAQVEVLLELFEKDITDVPYSMGDSFTWGYCLTCHKSQASEWGRVLVFDQGGSFRDKTRPNNGYTPPDSGDYTYPNRWRYTAVTRASEMVTIIRRRP
jgi:ATP-dependent exoDNAse (exonuclease V) alpha subunit